MQAMPPGHSPAAQSSAQTSISPPICAVTHAGGAVPAGGVPQSLAIAQLLLQKPSAPISTHSVAPKQSTVLSHGEYSPVSGCSSGPVAEPLLASSVCVSVDSGGLDSALVSDSPVVAVSSVVLDTDVALVVGAVVVGAVVVGAVVVGPGTVVLASDVAPSSESTVQAVSATTKVQAQR